MTVVNHTANHLWLQLVKNQQKINLLVVVMLAFFLLSYAAELTWRLWPQPFASSRFESISSSQSVSLENSNSRLNLTDIKRLNLFGDSSCTSNFLPAVYVCPLPHKTPLCLLLVQISITQSQQQHHHQQQQPPRTTKHNRQQPPPTTTANNTRQQPPPTTTDNNNTHHIHTSHHAHK